MLQFYIPEVVSVEQVMDVTEEVAQKEFDKLEKNIRTKEEWKRNKIVCWFLRMKLCLNASILFSIIQRSDSLSDEYRDMRLNTTFILNSHTFCGMEHALWDNHHAFSPPKLFSADSKLVLHLFWSNAMNERSKRATIAAAIRKWFCYRTEQMSNSQSLMDESIQILFEYYFDGFSSLFPWIYFWFEVMIRFFSDSFN